MRILGIDGVGLLAVAACRRDSRGSLSIEASAKRSISGEADRLPALVARCLAEAGWRMEDADIIACNVGPGGFTSIRTAVVLARALALASNRPVVAVTAFQSLAARARRNGLTGRITMVVGGMGATWFAQTFDGLHPIHAPDFLEAPLAMAGATTLVGGGFEGALQLEADAHDVADFASFKLDAGEQAVAGSLLTPFYLRSADARQEAGRSLLDGLAS